MCSSVSAIRPVLSRVIRPVLSRAIHPVLTRAIRPVLSHAVLSHTIRPVLSRAIRPVPTRAITLYSSVSPPLHLLFCLVVWTTLPGSFKLKLLSVSPVNLGTAP